MVGKKKYQSFKLGRMAFSLEKKSFKSLFYGENMKGEKENMIDLAF